MELSTTAELRDRGVLSDLDHELAETLASMVSGTGPEVRLGAALASWAVQNGHVCADLELLSRRPWHDAEGAPIDGVRLPPVDRWVAALGQSPLVLDAGAPPDAAPRPLVLDRAGRLYLYRYFRYERQLVDAIRGRTGTLDDTIDGATLRAGLDRLLPAGDPKTALQRVAALLSMLHRFTVISGGPGTGKTFTVAKVLLLLQEQARARGAPWRRIVLLAPTGKAAQRLGEAIGANLEALAWDPDVAQQVPAVASTIHRTLGYQPRTPTRFRHDRRNPLAADVVVVDEASMVDVALMAKLVNAVPADARLILLGDRDQLASVEAGAILGDIYGPRTDTGYSPALADRVRALSGDELPASAEQAEPALGDCMVHLTHSHRFPGGSGIAALSEAVNAGDADAALSALADWPDVELCEIDDPRELEHALGPVVLSKYGTLGEAPVAEKLSLLGAFRILCAHRRGPLGVEAVNDFAERHLRRHGRLETSGAWYDGRPILVTANDYQVDLFNGDIGVMGRADDNPDAPLVAFFPSTSSETPLRHLAPGRLPAHETVFAMSVHKAQGSELDEVALLLPPRVSPVVTRELLYTGVTRAKKRVTIYGKRDVLRAAVSARVQRGSGLRDGLWGRPTFSSR